MEKIVLGFPKHMNSDIGERAEKSLEFPAICSTRRTGLEVVMWDERLTTVVGGADADRERRPAGEPQEVYRQDRGGVYSAGVSGLSGDAEGGAAGRGQLIREVNIYGESEICPSGNGSGEDEFFVLEETKINGAAYILVSDSEDDDGECLILKEVDR